MCPPIRIGVVTVSDRASRGEYEDKGGPAIVTSKVTMTRSTMVKF